MVYIKTVDDNLESFNIIPFEGYTDTLSEHEFFDKYGISVENESSLEVTKLQKYAELNIACQQVIYDGFDAKVETGTEHFSLKDEDQINLQTAYDAIKGGAMGYPYHSDGTLCRLFKADEITLLANSAIQHKLYHTTYCNHLFRWIDRLETSEEVSQVYYGAELPEDLQKNMDQVMAGVKTSV